jgi:Tol biopolymer transport system component
VPRLLRLSPARRPPAADLSRQFVEELSAYKRVKASLLTPPVSESFSPDGSRIAMTERIKVYTVGVAGAHTDIWLQDTNEMGPLGWVVWSPSGEYLAFTVGYKNPKCRPCVSTVLLHLADGEMTFLQAPDNLHTDAPRWTQEGRLLVNVHPGEPAQGTAYVYNIYE